jgi:hypothetical protein
MWIRIRIRNTACAYSYSQEYDPVCVQQEKENLVAASLTLSQRLATGVSCTWYSPSSALSSNQGKSEAFAESLLMIFATISEEKNKPMRFLPLPPLELVPVQIFNDVLDLSSYFLHGRNVLQRKFTLRDNDKAVLGIHDILVADPDPRILTSYFWI